MNLRTATIAILSGLVACALPPRQNETNTARTEQGLAVSAAPPIIRLRHRGTNLSGGEFGSVVPGTYDRDYRYPGPVEVDYFVARRMNHFRIPFRHERLQRTLKTALNEEEWTRLLAVIDYTLSKGASVTIEPHNYARFNGRVVTETEFGDFWGRVAVRLKTRDRIYLNLTNEPHDLPTEQWVKLANAALKEIRAVGFRGPVVVPGNGWAGGGHWASNWYGTPNSVAMLNVVDPANNVIFEVHQYLDANADGSGDCVSATIGVERLSAFTSWLHSNKKHGFLGEIGAPNTTKCQAAVKKTLEFVESHYDVWVGWLWWSAGVWSFATTYPLSIGPVKDGEPDKPQMTWLANFLSCER